MDLYYQSLIIFGLILTPFETSSIFGTSWGGIENWLEQNQTTIGKFSLPKSMQRSLAEKAAYNNIK